MENIPVPTGVSVSRDVLMTAEVLAPTIGAAQPRWRICSLEGGFVPLQGGFWVQTTRLPGSDHPDRSVWLLAGLGLNIAAEVDHRLRDADVVAMAARVRQHIQQVGCVAAACSAVFLLHAAGVLGQKTVTTTGWLGPLLQELEPSCRVDTDRMVCGWTGGHFGGSICPD